MATTSGRVHTHSIHVIMYATLAQLGALKAIPQAQKLTQMTI